MFEFKRFIPIAKVDEDQRMVYGYASTPDLDSQGEIVSLDGLKKALPEYLQYPTLREMHQSKVAGTVKNTEIREGKDKGLYIGAKVVADDAWNFVKEGVYRGFSIGGNVVHKAGNIITDLELVEISLVDVPANKKASIEVWKRGISKDAETVYSLTNVMVMLKDTIEYFKFLEKPTKDLEKALEAIKGVISVEAGESEKDSAKRWEEMLLSDNPEDILKLIDSLDRVTFDNPVAETLRKVVKKNMANKLNKDDTPVAELEVVEPETEQPVVEVEEKAEESTEVETPEESTEETPEAPVEEAEEVKEETEEVKETADLPEFQKLDEVATKLEKMGEPSMPDYGKGFEKVASTLEKMTTIIEGLEKRIATLEDQPLPLKSKKYVEVKRDLETVEESSEVAKKKARLAELETILEKVGPNNFAKQGYAIEAAKIQDELARL